MKNKRKITKEFVREYWQLFFYFSTQKKVFKKIEEVDVFFKSVKYIEQKYNTDDTPLILNNQYCFKVKFNDLGFGLVSIFSIYQNEKQQHDRKEKIQRMVNG